MSMDKVYDTYQEWKEEDWLLEEAEEWEEAIEQDTRLSLDN